LPKGFVQLLVRTDVISALVLSASEGKGTKRRSNLTSTITAPNEILARLSVLQNNVNRGLHSD
jgi:hypothetical protein